MQQPAVTEAQIRREPVGGPRLPIQAPCGKRAPCACQPPCDRRPACGPPSGTAATLGSDPAPTSALPVPLPEEAPDAPADAPAAARQPSGTVRPLPPTAEPDPQQAAQGQSPVARAISLVVVDRLDAAQ
jgi:hypothetical protein